MAAQQRMLTEEQEKALADAPMFGVWFAGKLDEDRTMYPAKLVPAISKAGNVFWQIVGSKGTFGVHIKPQFPGLPSRVTITGLEEAIVPEDPSKPKGPKVRVLRKPEGSKDLPMTLEHRAVMEDGSARPAMEFQGKRVLPNGEERLVRVVISLRKDNQWNVKVACTGLNGEAGPMDDIVFALPTRV